MLYYIIVVVCLEEKDKDQMTKRLGEVHQMIEQLTVVAKQQKSKLISGMHEIWLEYKYIKAKIYIHRYVYMYVCVYILTYIHTYICTGIQHAYTHTHTDTHTFIHIYIHTCT